MKYFVVDSFSEQLFKGNQAGVCLLDYEIDSTVMQSIAAENNLAETAFVVKRSGDYDYDYNLRWFTPKTEIDLCGHATLASAYIISNFVDQNTATMNFHTKSGVLPVVKTGDLFEMDFPAKKPVPIPVTPLMEQAIGVTVLEAHLSRDMLLLVESEQQIKELKPGFELIAKLLDCMAVMVTAKGDEVDFVSRFFAPKVGIPEDPVTGSSHCELIPLWSEKLKKDRMTARQLSKRGGTLYCTNCGERVKIAGKAALYLKGEIEI